MNGTATMSERGTDTIDKMNKMKSNSATADLRPVNLVNPVPSSSPAPDRFDRYSSLQMMLRMADLAVRNLNTLANYIEEHHDELPLFDVTDALDEIDAARRAINLGGLADVPLVALGPSASSIPRSAFRVPHSSDRRPQ